MKHEGNGTSKKNLLSWKNKRAPLRFLSDTDLSCRSRDCGDLLLLSEMCWQTRCFSETSEDMKRPTGPERWNTKSSHDQRWSISVEEITVISFVCVTLQKLFKWLNNAAYSMNAADALFLEVRDINSVCTVHVLYMWVWRLRSQYCQVLLSSDRQEAWEDNKGSFPYQPS